MRWKQSFRIFRLRIVILLGWSDLISSDSDNSFWTSGSASRHQLLIMGWDDIEYILSDCGADGVFMILHHILHRILCGLSDKIEKQLILCPFHRIFTGDNRGHKFLIDNICYLLYIFFINSNEVVFTVWHFMKNQIIEMIVLLKESLLCFQSLAKYKYAPKM